MKLSEMYPSNLLKAADVTEGGGEMQLKVVNIEMKEFDQDGGGKETKPILIFEGDKRMVLNKTNAHALADMHGDDTDLWIGKTITLIVQNVDFAGKSTPAIRIKNLNSKDMLITEYWTKVREIGMTREEGLAHLAQSNKDFATALNNLNSPF